MEEISKNLKEICQFYEKIFPDKESDKSCPECAKSSYDFKWKPWMGSFKDHLKEHYRTKFAVERAKSDDKYKKEKYMPWSEEYEEPESSKIDKFYDPEIFADYFERKREKEERRKEAEAREKKRKMLVDREREARAAQFQDRIKNNSALFSESDDEDDEDTKNERKENNKKRKRKLASSSDEENISQREQQRKRKKSMEQYRDHDARLQAEIRENLQKYGKSGRRVSPAPPPRERKASAPEKPKKTMLTPHMLQKHNLGFKSFCEIVGELPQWRYCPMCDREINPSDFGVTSEISNYDNYYAKHMQDCLAA